MTFWALSLTLACIILAYNVLAVRTSKTLPCNRCGRQVDDRGVEDPDEGLETELNLNVSFN